MTSFVTSLAVQRIECLLKEYRDSSEYSSGILILSAEQAMLTSLLAWFRRLFRRRQKLTEDEQWAEWRKHIDRIYNETVRVFRNRLVFREIQTIFRENEQLQKTGGLIYSWLLELYRDHIVMAIRREVDRSYDSLNMNQLLTQMIKRPRVVSRPRYKAHFPKDTVIPDFMQDEQFDRLAGKGQYMDVAVLKKDRRLLDKRVDQVVKFANKGVAHRTNEEVQLTIDHVDKALDEIEKMLQKYYVVLTGAGLVGAEPAIQYNWMEPFTFAWKPRKPFKIPGLNKTVEEVVADLEKLRPADEC